VRREFWKIWTAKCFVKDADQSFYLGLESLGSVALAISRVHSMLDICVYVNSLGYILELIIRAAHSSLELEVQF